MELFGSDNVHGISEFWGAHADLKQVQDIQAFGKMEEAAGAADSADLEDLPEEADSNEDDSDESEGDVRRVQPKVQNAFALLSDGDE